MDTLALVFVLLLGTDVLALVIMILMLTYEKLFPKEEVEKDSFKAD